MSASEYLNRTGIMSRYHVEMSCHDVGAEGDITLRNASDVMMGCHDGMS